MARKPTQERVETESEATQLAEKLVDEIGRGVFGEAWPEPASAPAWTHEHKIAVARMITLEYLLREILLHTHATARLPPALLERVKAAVGE